MKYKEEKEWVCKDCNIEFKSNDKHHHIDYCPKCEKSGVDHESDLIRIIGNVYELTHLNKVMNKMFSYVNEKYSSEIVRQEDWYNKHTWTEKQQLDFVDWFVDYLYKDKEARNSILNTGSMRISKGRIRKAVWQFVFNYGWVCEPLPECDSRGQKST